MTLKWPNDQENFKAYIRPNFIIFSQLQFFFISRVLAEEWERREELERLQEEQNKMLEEERLKRKQFEMLQAEKEAQYRGKLFFATVNNNIRFSYFIF